MKIFARSRKPIFLRSGGPASIATERKRASKKPPVTLNRALIIGENNIGAPRRAAHTPLAALSATHYPHDSAQGFRIAHRHLERQFGPPKAAPPPRLSEGGSARRSLPTRDQVPR